MPDSDRPLGPTELRQRALSTWDNEGGALAAAHRMDAVLPDLSNAELVQLRIRVIALENLMIAVLAEGSDRQLQVAQAMADFISPRLGFTHHPLTIRAADHMSDLVHRAVHFQTMQPR